MATEPRVLEPVPVARDTQISQRAPAGQAATRSPPQAQEEFESSFAVGEISVRYVTLRDRSFQNRSDWLVKIFPDIQMFHHIENDFRHLSPRLGGFDALIVGGNDQIRLSNILKKSHQLLYRLPKIAITDELRPPKAAKLLNSGFDDVFDREKVTPEEVVARMRRICGRYRDANLRFERKEVEESRIGRVAQVSRLNNRERNVVLRLMRIPGKVVPYYSVQVAASEFEGEISLSHLRVIISNLRKKLINGVQICAENNVGYSIYFP